jgi:hypothetical protein
VVIEEGMSFIATKLPKARPLQVRRATPMFVR